MLRIAEIGERTSKQEVTVTSATKAVVTSYPVLKTPYNIKNPPKDIEFHLFGDSTDKEVEKGEQVKTEVTISIDNATLIELAKNHIDTSKMTTKTNTALLKALKAEGLNVITSRPK